MIILKQNNSIVQRNILIFIDWFLPGYKAGGPIRSINNLTNLLSQEVNLFIVTSNKDEGEDLPYANIPTGQWIEHEKYVIQYVGDDLQTFSYYKELLSEREYSSIYINSIFSFSFSILPLIVALRDKQKVVLAPRGMLGKGALGIKSFKKKIFLQIFDWLGWHKKVLWHLTAESEVFEVKDVFGDKIEYRKISNVPASPPKLHKKVKEENSLNLFFLSRISYKKNLLGAISFLSEVSNNYKINLTIIGPAEEIGYWEKCQHAIDQFPDHIKVNYLGTIKNELLSEILKDQHVLVLPTLSENYGHVIVEAWQNACPVIISDQTPWLNLEKNKIGFDISLNDPHLFTHAIESFARMDDENFQKWSKSAYKYGSNLLKSEQLKKAYLSMLKIDC